MEKKKRAYISDRFVLELDGGSGGAAQYVGTLQSVEGGAKKSDAIEEKVGSEVLSTRYPGRPKFEDITIQVGMALLPRFWKWISKSLDNYNAERQSGSIVALDFDNNERWRRDFQNAIITEVGFPALDGAAKEPAYLTVKFAIESIEMKKSGAKYPAERETQNEWTKQRLWLPSNFTFKLDQFPQDGLANAKIDAFTVKQNVITCPVGPELVPTKQPGRVEFPNLSVTVLERDADPWLEWYKNLVREGQHAQKNEKSGHISYLSRNTKESPLLVVDFFNMGILAINPVKHDSKQHQIQKIKIDMYCESLKVNTGKGTVA